MRKVKVHYLEKLDLIKVYEVEDGDFEDLINGECQIYDITNIDGDAESYGDNWVEYEVFDENGKEISGGKSV